MNDMQTLNLATGFQFSILKANYFYTAEFNSCSLLCFYVIFPVIHRLRHADSVCVYH